MRFWRRPSSSISAAVLLAIGVLVHSALPLPMAMGLPSNFQGAPSYAGSVLADSPSGYWRLGEPGGPTAFDTTGAGNGVYADVPTLGRASLLPSDTAGKAAHFDGLEDYVLVPSSGLLSPGERVTLEAWINPTSLPSGPANSVTSFASIMTKPESYSLQLNGPRPELTIMQSGDRRRLKAPAPVVAGRTYYVAGTYDGSTQRLYVNGVQVASAALDGPITTNDEPLTIGSWDGRAVFLTGTIDEVAVYATVLSPARIKAHYRAGVMVDMQAPGGQ